jgi:electron transport complex protein RnfC
MCPQTNKPAAYDPQPPRPEWGIRPPTRKTGSLKLPILEASPPGWVVIPIEQCLGVSARAIVTPGQHVLTGEPIAQADSVTGTDPGPKLHASISGEVIGIENNMVPGTSAHREPCIVIRSDGKDETYSEYKNLGDPLQMDAGKICSLIAEAGIVGLGGALFSTAAKLQNSSGIRMLILNGAECEPYITCDEMLLRERARKVARGAQIMMRALGAPDTVIAIESDMPEARVAIYDAIEELGDDRIHESVVTAKYPAGGERQIIQLVMGEEVPEGSLPNDIGYVCHNVATAAAIAEFFDEGRPLISRIVTVTGGGIEAARNVDVRIGTIMADLFELIGGYYDVSSHLIMGGPMMGVCLPNDELPVTKATNCLIIMKSRELSPPRQEMPCIRCGECNQVCPAQLLPQELLTASQQHDMEALDTFGLNACIECGCCDYVCPSYIPLTAQFASAKLEFRTHESGMQRAAHARGRYEARASRLQQEQAERDKQLQEQVDAVSGTESIDAVMKRVASRDKKP